MNRFMSKNRTWGKNDDGTKYVTGLTVGELKKKLEEFQDTDEVCMAVCPKKYWNGGGYLGALRVVEEGSTGQIWLKGSVIDPSLE